MRYAVTGNWAASYADPIRVLAGDILELSGREENWDGHVWLWAGCACGREGWIPDDLPIRLGKTVVAGADYSAVELTCQEGQIVRGLCQSHGWALCVSPEGVTGWVPLNHLERLSDTDERGLV